MRFSFWRWTVTYFGWVVAITALVFMMQEQMFKEAYQYEAKEAQYVSRACIMVVSRITESHDKCNRMVDQCISHMKTEKVSQFEYKALIAKSLGE